uniref:Ig-like domain-containing protein n=1 Tax=Esox lucius TaxID=8010 RepID=A0AAY5KIF4_ESOLU
MEICLSLIITPDRSQFFEYESVSLSCEVQGNSAKWRVVKNAVKASQNPGSSYRIPSTKTSDSGLYWCQSWSGEHSKTVNITVHGGHVILESPALPVTEGHSVILNCRYKKGPSNLTADFYKNGSFIRTETNGGMTIPAVNKSDEGLYSCRHPELGRSPERLADSSFLFCKLPPPPPPTPPPLPPLHLSSSLCLCLGWWLVSPSLWSFYWSCSGTARGTKM